MTDEGWITLPEAVELIRARLSASLGRSQSVMNAACLSGEVRSHKPVTLWADDGIGSPGKPSIRYSKDDLVDWLGRNHPRSQATTTDEKPRRNASREEIRVEIRAVYNEAGDPNIKILADLVEPRLRGQGLYASKNSIMEIGSEPEFKARRRPPGKTKASERHR